MEPKNSLWTPYKEQKCDEASSEMCAVNHSNTPKDISNKRTSEEADLDSLLAEYESKRAKWLRRRSSTTSSKSQEENNDDDEVVILKETKANTFTGKVGSSTKMEPIIATVASTAKPGK